MGRAVAFYLPKQVERGGYPSGWPQASETRLVAIASSPPKRVGRDGARLAHRSGRDGGHRVLFPEGSRA